MTITKAQKIEATIKAVQAKYKVQVETLEKELKDMAINAITSDPYNKKAAAWLATVPEEYVKYTQIRSSVYLSYYVGKISYTFFTRVNANTRLSNKEVTLFGTTYDSGNIILDSPILDVSDGIIKGVAVSKIQEKRKDLQNEIVQFTKELFSALEPIRTEKKLKEQLPNMVKFFEFTSKDTSMVASELNNKINSALADV